MSSNASTSPEPAANSAASGGAIHEHSSATNSPGTATAPSGMAARLAITPTGATVPNANAVMGAVSSVAAAEGSSSWSGFGYFAATRPAQITVATAATDSHAPTERTAHGSSTSRISVASPTVPRGATTRSRSRATPSSVSISADRTAGAGAPSTHT